MPTIRVNDIHIYYEINGELEPIVLIAGLGTEHKVYKPIIDDLSPRYKVLAFDNRGVGRSDRPDAPYTIEMMANDTAALMKEVGIEKANVLGFSMGGKIAMVLALQHPEMVKSLVLTSTTARPTGRPFPIRFKIFKMIRGSRMFGSKQPYPAFVRQLTASHSYDCSERLKEIKTCPPS